MKKLLAMLLALTLMLGAVPCLAEAGESETPLKLQWSQAIGIDTLFESPARDQQSLYPYMVFDTLMYWDGTNSEHVPALATEWSNNEDYTEFTLTIRDGVKWHDGETLTAEDVAFTIEYYIANPNSSGARRFQYVEGYDALKNGEAEHLSGMSVEGNVITLKLAKSYPLFLSGVYSTMILPKHLLGNMAWADIDSSDFWKKPIGCGAYRINEVSFPDYFTCVRFEDYWGEPAGIKNVQFVSYQTGGNEAAVAAMINGDIDFGTRQLITDRSIANNMIRKNADLKALTVNAHNMR